MSLKFRQSVIIFAAVSVIAGGCSGSRISGNKTDLKLNQIPRQGHFMYADVQYLSDQPTLFDTITFGGFSSVPAAAQMSSIDSSSALDTTNPVKIEEGIRVRAESGLARFTNSVYDREKTTVAIEKQIAKARLDPQLEKQIADLRIQLANEELRIRQRFISRRLDLLLAEAVAQSRPRVLGLPVEEDAAYKAIKEQLAALDQQETEAVRLWEAESEDQIQALRRDHEALLGRAYSSISADSRRRIDELVQRRSSQVRQIVDSFLENFFATLQKPEVSSSARVVQSPDASLRIKDTVAAFTIAQKQLEDKMSSNARLAERIVQHNSSGRSSWTENASRHRAGLLIQGQP